jgi:hypothetical protein
MSFRYLRDPLFLTCASSYLANNCVVKPHLHSQWSAAFFQSYFDDLLLVPCLLPALLRLHRWLSIPEDEFPTAREVLVHLVVWSLYLEMIGPAVQGHGVSDPFDVACYWVGGFVSFLMEICRASPEAMRLCGLNKSYLRCQFCKPTTQHIVAQGASSGCLITGHTCRRGDAFCRRHTSRPPPCCAPMPFAARRAIDCGEARSPRCQSGYTVHVARSTKPAEGLGLVVAVRIRRSSVRV